MPGKARDSRQMSLFDASTPALLGSVGSGGTDIRERDLFRRLSRLLDRELGTLKLHDNQRTILSFKPEGQASARLELRLHRSFLWAPKEVLEAVSTFVRSRRKSPRAREALLRIREHFTQNRTEGGRKRRVVLRPRGETYDLEEMRDRLVAEFFGGRLLVPITWGRQARPRRPGRRRTSTIQLGCYSYEDHLIRVNPLLDDPTVPRAVVESVVYHELLHAALPPVAQGTRRCV